MLATHHVVIIAAPSLTTVLLNILPKNPFQALAEGAILQLIFLAIFMGVATIRLVGASRDHLVQWFEALNALVMSMLGVLVQVMPLGIFCLVAKVAADLGPSLLPSLFGYMLVVLLVLFLHLIGVYGGMLSSVVVALVSFFEVALPWCLPFRCLAAAPRFPWLCKRFASGSSCVNQ